MKNFQDRITLEELEKVKSVVRLLRSMYASGRIIASPKKREERIIEALQALEILNKLEEIICLNEQ